jgi:hypothetical protein
MSHIATVKTKIKDLGILEEVLKQQNIDLLRKQHQVELYSNSVQAIASFRLPKWKFPIAVKADGSIAFDNYKGKWGNQTQLNKVLQAYSRKVVMKQAKRMGMTTTTKTGKDGSLVMTLVGG